MVIYKTEIFENGQSLGYSNSDDLTFRAEKVCPHYWDWAIICQTMDLFFIDLRISLYIFLSLKLSRKKL